MATVKERSPAKYSVLFSTLNTHNFNMNTRVIVLLLGVVFLLPCYSLQRRILMPGCHVERVGQGPVSSIPKIVVAKRERKRTELRESIVSLPEHRSAHTALRSKKPSPLPIASAHDVKFLRTRQEAQPIAKQIPTQTSGHIKERVGLNASAPGEVGPCSVLRLSGGQV